MSRATNGAMKHPSNCATGALLTLSLMFLASFCSVAQWANEECHYECEPTYCEFWDDFCEYDCHEICFPYLRSASERKFSQQSPEAAAVAAAPLQSLSQAIKGSQRHRAVFAPIETLEGTRATGKCNQFYDKRFNQIVWSLSRFL